MEIQGIKNLHIIAKTSYPIITAYEFEFLKTEEEIKALLKPSTIYFIVQRPLIYISNLTLKNGVIYFEIKDNLKNKPLECSIDPAENNFSAPDKDLLVSLHFYKNIPDKKEPFNDIAAIKLYNTENEFIVWYTPQKIIYEHLSGSLKVHINGSIKEYIDYHVHYIGQSFSQNIWDRLTGHEKMQAVLTKENIINNKASKNSFEISLILLEVEGYDEIKIMPYYEWLVPNATKPLLFNLETEEDIEKFYLPLLKTNASELTNEIEALLINSFKPEYNNILFKNYPEIKSGTRSVGYTESKLILRMLPAILKTDYHTQGIVVLKNI